MVAEPRLGCLVGGGREYPAGGSSRVGGCWVRGLGGSAGVTRSTSPKPTGISHMRAGVSFHRGPPDSDVVALDLSIEDPCSLLVDYDPLTHPPTPDPLTKGLLRSLHHHTPRAFARSPMAILLAALTSVFYGVFDFAGGMATRRASVFAVIFWSNIMDLVLSGFIAFVYHQVFGATFTLPTWPREH